MPLEKIFQTILSNTLHQTKFLQTPPSLPLPSINFDKYILDILFPHQPSLNTTSTSSIPLSFEQPHATEPPTLKLILHETIFISSSDDKNVAAGANDVTLKIWSSLINHSP